MTTTMMILLACLIRAVLAGLLVSSNWNYCKEVLKDKENLKTPSWKENKLVFITRKTVEVIFHSIVPGLLYLAGAPSTVVAAVGIVCVLRVFGLKRITEILLLTGACSLASLLASPLTPILLTALTFSCIDIAMMIIASSVTIGASTEVDVTLVTKK